jgi:5-methylcytosine-specific restriction endonuclease McrA
MGGRKDPAARRAYAREYHARNRERLNARNRAYYARNKKQIHARTRAYLARNRKRFSERDREYRAKIRSTRPDLVEKTRERRHRYHQLHKKEINERMRRLRTENPQLAYKYVNAWRARHPGWSAKYDKPWKVKNRERWLMIVRIASSKRRARKKANGPYERIDPLKVLERDAGLCGICGRQVDPTSFEIDHIIPVSRGGLDLMSNVQLAHRSCNRKKWAKMPSATRSS